MLGLLDGFTPETPVRTTEELIQASGASRSSTYRYVRALHRTGFLAPVANGRYVLGPRILELDRQIRSCDPLYAAGTPLLLELAAATGTSALLCALTSDSVVCIQDRPAEGAPAGLFGRGQRRPLLAGAASKAILAFLPPHQTRTLYARHRDAVAAAGLGREWEEFRDALRRMRRDGFVRTEGEFNPGVVGISAPVFNRAGQVLGSIGVAFHAGTTRDEDALIARVRVAAEKTTTHLGRDRSVMDRPPRAVGGAL